MPDPLSNSDSLAERGRATLRAITLTDFRNYTSATLRIDAALVALTGENGAGKTNLLEAISLLSPGRGLRRARLEEMTRIGAAGGWVVSATVARDDAETRIGTGIAPGPSAEGFPRTIRIDGVPLSSSEDLLDYLRILWLTPAMDGLFSGPPSERRRFLDRLVLAIDATHARRVREFERLMTQRNRLLDENAGARWLDAIEVELAERAVAVALARAETATLLSAQMRREEDAPSGFPAGRLSLSGAFEAAIAGKSAAEAELWYRGALAEGRAADRMAGRTLEGPHRSDLEVFFAVKAMPAALSSTGEQKALLIGVVLAQAAIVTATSGMAPVLLLDEVAAHLDVGRRAALFGKLAALGCQAFMTGADPAFFGEMPAGEAFRVAGNALTPVGRRIA